jgi:hypothetical protein
LITFSELHTVTAPQKHISITANQLLTPRCFSSKQSVDPSMPLAGTQYLRPRIN